MILFERVDGFDDGGVEEGEVGVSEEESGQGFWFVVFEDGAIGVGGAVVESVGVGLDSVWGVAERVKVGFFDVGGEVGGLEVG